jgi:shikimate dehydrogenase
VGRLGAGKLRAGYIRWGEALLIMSRNAAFGGKQNRFYEIGDGSAGLAVANTHYAAAKEQGFQMTYIPKKVERSDLASTYRSLRESAAGFAITSPYKSDILMLLDSIDDDARTVGACNVIGCEAERFKGYNTDWVAIRNVLRKRTMKPVLNKALVIGTGAAARASLYALWRLGFTKMTMAGRNEASTQAIVRGLGFVMGVDASAILYPDALKSLDLGAFDVIVNATPLGTKEGEDPTMGAPMSQSLTVVDLALPPKETALVRRGNDSGCVVVPGGEVAAEQARLDIQAWVGKPFS